MDLDRRRFLEICLAAGIGGSGCTDSTPFLAGKAGERWAPGWAAASGRHYESGREEGPGVTPESRSLYKTVRAPAFQWTVGLPLDVTDRPPERWPGDVTSLEGPFSGETRYYDFGSVDREDSMAAEVAGNTRGGLDGLMLVESDFEDRLEENVEYFKDAVYAAATFFSTDAFASRPIRYWEIGNEVNNVEYFDPRGIVSDDDEDVWEYFNDPEQARLYVDLFLGPAIEALRRAGRDAHGDPGYFTVMNGGVAEINYEETHEWLERVLERKPSAEGAPSIADSPVVDHLDAVAIHYAFVPHFDESPYDMNWEETLSALYRRWIDPGIVDGVWHTEEGGDAGWGASHLVFAMPRLLNWWSGREWTADRARLIWWPTPGGPDSPTAEDLQSTLVDLWDSRERLLDLSDDLVVDQADSLYGYAFATSDDAPPIGVFMGGRPSPEGRNGDPTDEFSGFRLENVPESFDPETYDADAYVVEPDRLASFDLELEVAGSDTVHFDHRPMRLAPYEAITALIEPRAE